MAIVVAAAVDDDEDAVSNFLATTTPFPIPFLISGAKWVLPVKHFAATQEENFSGQSEFDLHLRSAAAGVEKDREKRKKSKNTTTNGTFCIMKSASGASFTYVKYNLQCRTTS